MNKGNSRTLPADVYDALEFSALVTGGIGAGDYWEFVETVEIPYCIRGHAFAVVEGERRSYATPSISLDLTLTGGVTYENDEAVHAINKRKGNPPFEGRNARVSFEEWCTELNITRGD